MTTINLILLATLLLVVILEGFNWFAIWAAVPLLMAAVLTEFSLSAAGGEWARLSVGKRFAIVGLITGVVTVTLYMHVTLFFAPTPQPGEEDPSRFTYMLAPLYAMVGGAAGYVLGYAYGVRLSTESGRIPPPRDPRDEIKP